MEWLNVNFPDRVSKVVSRIKGLRGGKMNDPRFGYRMKGNGIWSEQISKFFRLIRSKWGLVGGAAELRTDLFCVPGGKGEGSDRQLELF
jgi:hypothetical protein